MTQQLFIITTRGKHGKEVYLAVDEKSPVDKVLMKWTENIDEAMATFTYKEVEDYANNYFKNYKKWYIKNYTTNFN